VAEPANEKPGNWAAPFFTIWTGQALSILGSQLVQFALIWWLTVETGSATVLATASILGMLPAIFLGPLAGAVVDRHNRRRIMIIADSCVALATLALAGLFALGEPRTWQVYAILLARALAGSFHWPALAASTSLMVPRQHLARVQGANQALNGGLRILSAPLGALLLSLLPIQGILGIDVLTALLAVLPLLFIQIPQPPRSAIEGGTARLRPSIWADMLSGLLYVRQWPGVLTLIIMAAVCNFMLSPAYALMPILVKDFFSGGAMQLAWMEAAGGIGVILGGLLLSIWGGFRRRVMTSLVGLIGIGLGTLLVGLTPATLFLLAVASILWVGFMLSLTNGPLLAVVQAVVAPQIQGRVLALIDSLATAMAPLGLAVAGPLTDAVGVKAWFIAAGVVTGLMGVIGWLTPSVLHVEDHAYRGEGAEAAAEAAAIGAADPLEGG
jgi:DHA3 family macrolide efflux protein-like MFS transporter